MTRWKSLALLAGVLAFAPLVLTDQQAAAQPGAKPLRVVFSDNPDKPDNPRSNLRLRPNTLQAFYLYVLNSSDKAADATVQLAVNGQPLEGLTQKVKVDANGQARVRFAKAAPADKAAPAPAPAADKGPQLTDLAGPLQVRLLDNQNKVLDEAEVRVSRPDEYVEVTNIQFDPKDNTLTVALKAKPEFTGPRARVELVLRDDRIPALVAGQKKDGSYAGHLGHPGDTLILEARNLQLRPGGDRNGLVYLTIDGYERAFTFRSTFAGDQVSEPKRIDDAILRLDAARALVPGAASKVRIEVDNAPADAAAELGLYRNRKFDVAEGEIMEFSGDRQVRLAFNPNGPNGALLFKSVVSDWSPGLDTAEIFGTRALRLRLVRSTKDDQGKVIKKELEFIDSGKPIEVLPDGTVKKTDSIVEGLILDATKPEGVKFVNFPAKLNRSAPLPVQAVGRDPESDIKQVVFYGGKPLPDGKFPPELKPIAGRPVADAKDTWAALLPSLTDKKGPVDVTVQFTNGAGLTTTETITIQLVDPEKPGDASKKASIAGNVVEGDRPQPNLRVYLFDERGAARDSVLTDGSGNFLFKEVVPGAYRVVSVKSGSTTRAEVPVQVLEGEKRTGVVVRMLR